MLPHGYQYKTTFWMDFSIADRFGTSAVKDTYDRSIKDWGKNLEYITEMVLVLNWKIWQHYEEKNEALARLYDNLWRQAEDYFYENFDDEDSLQYYFQMTD